MIKEYIEGSIANFSKAEKSESEQPLIVKQEQHELGF